MKQKPESLGKSGFVCLGCGGSTAMLGLLAVGAARAIGQSNDARGLDWENILWGLPWWLGNRLGDVMSWILVLIGVGMVVGYLIFHKSK